MVTTRQIKILTVDDHPILREGIASIIHGEKDMVVVGEASIGREAIKSLEDARLKRRRSGVLCRTPNVSR